MTLLGTSLFALALLATAAAVQLKEEYFWKQLDFEWPTPRDRERALRAGVYAPENNLPIGFDIWQDKIFISVPRYKIGVPSTLNYIKMGDDNSPNLVPYPSWKDNELPPLDNDDNDDDDNDSGEDDGKEAQDSSLTSVFRVWVDKCDRLWAFDSGQYNYTGEKKTLSNPSILIYDLKNDTLIKRFYFSSVEKQSFYGHIAIDSDPNSCDDAFAYITDLGASKLMVYSLANNESWDVRHHYFNFDPLEGTFDINGVNFSWTDGIVALALSKKDSKGLRRVFFHPTASTKEFEVSDEVLKNETWATSSFNFEDFKLVGERGPDSRATASFYEENSDILLYTQIQRNGLGCWNAKKKLNPETAVLFAIDDVKLEFPCDLKVRCDRNLWVLSNKLQRFIYSPPLDKNEINFRLFSAPIDGVVEACT